MPFGLGMLVWSLTVTERHVGQVILRISALNTAGRGADDLCVLTSSPMLVSVFSRLWFRCGHYVTNTVSSIRVTISLLSNVDLDSMDE
jgi:hypothetical protein